MKTLEMTFGFYMLSLTTVVFGQGGTPAKNIAPPGNLPPGISAPGDNAGYPVPPVGYLSTANGNTPGTGLQSGLQAYIATAASSPNTQSQLHTNSYLAGYGAPATDGGILTRTPSFLYTTSQTPGTPSTKLVTLSYSLASEASATSIPSRFSTAVVAAPSAFPNGVFPPGDHSGSTASTTRTGNPELDTNTNVGAPSALPPGISAPGVIGSPGSIGSTRSTGQVGLSLRIGAPSSLPFGISPPATEHGQRPVESSINKNFFATAHNSSKHNGMARSKTPVNRSRSNSGRPGKDFIAGDLTSTGHVSTGPTSRVVSSRSIYPPASLPLGVSTPASHETNTRAEGYDFIASSNTARNSQNQQLLIGSSSTMMIGYGTTSGIGGDVSLSPNTIGGIGSQSSTGASLSPAGPTSKSTLASTTPSPADSIPGYQIIDQGSSTSHVLSSESATAASTTRNSTSPSAVAAPSSLPNGVSPPSDEGSSSTSVPNGYPMPSQQPGPSSTPISAPGILPPAIAPPGESELGNGDVVVTLPSLAEDEALKMPTRKRILPAGPNASRSLSTTRSHRTPSGPRLTTPKSRAGNASTNPDLEEEGFTESIGLPKTSITAKASVSNRHQNGTLGKKTASSKLSAAGSLSGGKHPLEDGSKSGDAPSEALALLKSLKSNPQKGNGVESAVALSKPATPSHPRNLNDRPSRVHTMPPHSLPAGDIMAKRPGGEPILAASRRRTNSPTAAGPDFDRFTSTLTVTSTVPELKNGAKPAVSIRGNDLKLAVVATPGVAAPGQLPIGIAPPATSNQYNIPSPAPAAPQYPASPPPAQYPAPSPPAPAPPSAVPPGSYLGTVAPPGNLPVGVSPPSSPASYPSPPAKPGVYSPPGQYSGPSPSPSQTNGYESPSPDHSAYGPSINPNCVDVHPKCDYFVSNGKCLNPHFSAFVRQVCPRSCSACEVHAYGFHSAGGSTAGGYGATSSGSGGTYGSIGSGYGGGSYGGEKSGFGPGDFYFGPPTLPLGPPVGSSGCCGGDSGNYISGNTGYAGGTDIGCGSGGCASSGGNYAGSQDYGSSSAGCGASGCDGNQGYGIETPKGGGYSDVASGCGSGGCGYGGSQTGYGRAPSGDGYSRCGSAGCGPGDQTACGSGGCGASTGQARYGKLGSTGNKILHSLPLLNSLHTVPIIWDPPS